MRTFSSFFTLLLVSNITVHAQVKILFDATKAETAGNADWVIDADQHNLGWGSSGSYIGGSKSNAQQLPTPDQSTVTSTTAQGYWTGAISAWGIDCVKSGYHVETLPYNGSITYGNGSNPQDLSNYKVFVIDEPNIRFTATEQTAILSFVQNGGGLFMISDHDSSDRNNDGWDSPHIWNDLMSAHGNPFGITFDLLNYSPYPTSIPVPASDSVLNGPYGGVTAVKFSGGTTMTLNTTANPTVVGKIFDNTNGTAHGNPNSKVMFATCYYGQGKVAAMGDSSPTDDGTGNPASTLYDGWIADANGNHEKLIMNATIWLASTGSATALPNLNISGNIKICPGQSTTLTVSGANSYAWSGGQTTSSITVAPTQTTTYHVTGTNNNGSSSDSVTVTVNGSLPVPSFATVINNTQVTITDNTTGATGCVWNWGDGTSYTGCTPPAHTYAIGNYIITLITTNACGADSVTKTVSITANGIDENAELDNVKVFPNPANNELNIDFGGVKSIKSIEIMDLTGRIVMTENISSATNNVHINTSQLVGGIYIGRVNGNLFSRAFKFVKI